MSYKEQRFWLVVLIAIAAAPLLVLLWFGIGFMILAESDTDCGKLGLMLLLPVLLIDEILLVVLGIVYSVNRIPPDPEKGEAAVVTPFTLRDIVFALVSLLAVPMFVKFWFYLAHDSLTINSHGAGIYTDVIMDFLLPVFILAGSLCSFGVILIVITGKRYTMVSQQLDAEAEF